MVHLKALELQWMRHFRVCVTAPSLFVVHMQARVQLYYLTRKTSHCQS